MSETSQRRSTRVREISPNELNFRSKLEAAGFDFENDDRRRFQRAVMDVPVAIRLLGESERELCKGKAVLKDLSLEGAFLTAIEVEQTADDVSPEELGEFKQVEFIIMDGPFKGMEASAAPVRIGARAGGVGLRFEEGFTLEL